MFTFSTKHWYLCGRFIICSIIYSIFFWGGVKSKTANIKGRRMSLLWKTQTKMAVKNTGLTVYVTLPMPSIAPVTFPPAPGRGKCYYTSFYLIYDMNLKFPSSYLGKKVAITCTIFLANQLHLSRWN